MAAMAQDKPPLANISDISLHYGILLTPSVTPIDLFGPLDVFSSLAMSYLNDTGKNMRLSILSVNSTPSTTNPPMEGLNFGMALPPTITLDEYLKAAATNFSSNSSCSSSTVPGPLDVILVPGGGGTRKDVSHEIDFIKTVYPSLKHLISVCTGSTILARAGVLDNKQATTNKKSWTWATSFGRNVSYVPHARWVQDGNIWTGSGVSAAIDTAYAFVASVYGEEVAQYVADVSEYTRWTNQSYDPFAERW
ncbi:class I glutamine amidotransferase-like protein, partial [Bimuria novae-zelandiae CBS 107.79]